MPLTILTNKGKLFSIKFKFNRGTLSRFEFYFIKIAKTTSIRNNRCHIIVNK